MRESVSMVFGMVSRGDVEETNVTESTEVKEELDSWRCAKGRCGVMKIRIVLGDPPGREEAVLSGDVMREGASEVGGGVRRNGVVKMIEGILEVEDGGMRDMGSMRGMEGERGNSGRRG